MQATIGRMPPERRANLIRLLATINELIGEAELTVSDDLLSDEVRQNANVQLDFRRKSVERVEQMLAAIE